MSNLGPQHINLSFGGLLQLPNGASGSLATVQDGAGNATALEVSTTAVDFPIESPTGGASGMISDLATDAGSNFVGFEQAGTGAVTRSVQDKARETVSVLDFGADPTGATDSTANIQAALNTGHSIEFDGTFLISSSLLDVFSNRSIYFNKTTFVAKSGMTGFMWQVNNNADVVQNARYVGRPVFNGQNESVGGVIVGTSSVNQCAKLQFDGFIIQDCVGQQGFYVYGKVWDSYFENIDCVRSGNSTHACVTLEGSATASLNELIFARLHAEDNDAGVQLQTLNLFSSALHLHLESNTTTGTTGLLVGGATDRCVFTGRIGGVENGISILSASPDNVFNVNVDTIGAYSVYIANANANNNKFSDCVLGGDISISSASNTLFSGVNVTGKFQAIGGSSKTKLQDCNVATSASDQVVYINNSSNFVCNNCVITNTHVSGKGVLLNNVVDYPIVTSSKITANGLSLDAGSSTNLFLSGNQYSNTPSVSSFNVKFDGIDVSADNPAVTNARYLRTNGSFTLTQMSGGFGGQTVFVQFNSSVTVDFSGTTLKGNGGVDLSAVAGNSMLCVYDGVNWHCMIQTGA